MLEIPDPDIKYIRNRSFSGSHKEPPHYPLKHINDADKKQEKNYEV